MLIPCKRSPICKREIDDSVGVEFCGKCQAKWLNLRASKALSLYNDLDLRFFFLHTEGCDAKELRDHLGLATSVMNRYIRLGRIRVARQWKEGKFVHKTIDPEEMVRVVSLFHHWVSIYLLADQKKKKYSTLRSYAEDEDAFFGEIGENLEGIMSIHVSVLPDFEHRWARAERKRKNNVGARKHLLDSDELCLSAINEICNLHAQRSHKWFDRGYIKGCRKHGAVAVSRKHLKVFLMKAARKQLPVDFTLLEPLLDCDFLAVENGFAEQAREAYRRSKNRFRGFRSVLSCREVAMCELTEMSGANPSVPQGWFLRHLPNEPKGELQITTLKAVKAFILSVLRKEDPVKKVDTKWINNILESDLFQSLASHDWDFWSEVMKAREATA